MKSHQRTNRTIQPAERHSIAERVEPPDEKQPTDKHVVQPDERLQEVVAQALLPDEFDAVARDALKEASQAMAQGDHELVEKTLRLALVSARKSNNTQLVKTVVSCLLDARKGAKFLPVRSTEMSSPARNAAETADVKFPIPTKAERTESRRKILEVYGKNRRAQKDVVQKRTLAMEFLQTAKETQNDWVARFVLLDLAREEAVNGIDYPRPRCRPLMKWCYSRSEA